MGKIFSPEEIEHGHIPKEDDHFEAADYIADQLFFDQDAFSSAPLSGNVPSSYYEGEVEAGLIHGSVTHGTANRRSDVDVVIVYRPGSIVLDTIRNVFDVARSNFHVPIEANLVTELDAEKGAHSFDPLFLSYLLRAQKDPDYSWNWPIDRLTPEDYDPDEVSDARLVRTVQRYLGAKTASFSKELVADNIDLHRIQRALELPKNLGRKILSMSQRYSFVVEDHTTDGIVDSMLAFCEDQITLWDEVVQQVDEATKYLLKEDADYDELLEAVIKGRVSLAEYRFWYNDSKQRDILKQALLLCGGVQEVVAHYARRDRFSSLESMDVSDEDLDQDTGFIAGDDY